MSKQQTPVSEEEVHAYAGGTLSDERREQVEPAMELHPVGRASVRRFLVEQRLP